MPLKVEIPRDIPNLESLSSRDKQTLVLFLSGLFDILETISRRAQEAGILAEKLQKEQELLISNLGIPSVTANQDEILGTIGNLSSNLTEKTTAAAPYANDGYIVVRDNLGNTLKIMTTA